MYQHILVPVDGTELSIRTGEQAVDMACETKARITFLYATPDYGATSDGALLRSVAPNEFVAAASGDTDAILMKVLDYARAKGVQCDGRSRVSDRPYEAIIQTAQEQKCDLIFMASHGHRGLRGLLRGSQTEKVVRHSPISVLVASVETNDAQAAMHRALSVIHDEHRSMNVVIHGLLDYSRDALTGNATLDADLVRRMVAYLRDFPGAQHHPKEEKYIFAMLQLHTRNFDDVLGGLQREHHHEHALVTAVEKALDIYQSGVPESARPLNEALEKLAAHIRRHMGVEERTVLPAARAYLDNDDWSVIDKEFSENHDPGFGDIGEVNFSQLFSKIATLLPKA